MNLSRLIILLFILNLFFIGLMVGITFVKQNPATEFWGMLSDSSNNLPPMNRVKIFLVRLQKAGNYTACSIYNRWSMIVNYLKIHISDLNIISINNINTNSYFSGHKQITRDKPKTVAIEGKTSINRPEGNVKNRKPALLKETINIKADSKVPQSNISIGRSDPFLSLGEKFQPPVKTKVKKEPFKEHKTVSKTTVEPKLPSGPNMAEYLKLDKTEEKPGARILKDYHLRGVIIGDSPIAYIEDRNGYHKFQIGDYLAEGKIVGITETSLTFQIAGEQVVMRMEGLK